MNDKYMGRKYGKISNSLAVMGLKSYSNMFEVVDETELSVALKCIDYDDFSLSWILKEDISKALEQIK